MNLEAGAFYSYNYEVIRWRFQNSPLAELNRMTKKVSTHDDFHDGRFTGRLKLHPRSGDLTVTNITRDDSGPYEVIIKSNSGTHTVYKILTVTVSGEYIKFCDIINIIFTL